MANSSSGTGSDQDVIRRVLRSIGMTANVQRVAEILDLAAGLSDDDLAEFVALVHSRAAVHDLRTDRPAADRLN